MKGRILLVLAAFGCFFLFLAFQAATFFKHPTGTGFYHTIATWSSPENEPQESLGDVKTFVMFTGHARSGHSIVGAMLDAHPHMVVAHEYNIPNHWQEINGLAQLQRLPMREVIMQLLVDQSRKDSQIGNRQKKGSNAKGYEYYIPGQWQGRFDGQIKVIGDKKGTNTAKTMLHNPEFFHQLQETVGMPLKFIQVVRNPFDNIATMVLHVHGSRSEAGNYTPVNDTELLDKFMKNFIKVEGGSAKIRQAFPVLNVPSHHVVLKTKETLQKICKFLQVECTADYLDACASIVQEKVSVTRNLVVWTDDQKRWLLKEMQKYPWLRKFTFEDTVPQL